jgi:hypothetical protein
MFDDERSDAGTVALVHVGTGGEMGLAHVGTECGDGGVHAWREIDRALKRVANARGRLDAEELFWLARAERAEIHRQFGHATILEYVERVMGYGPRVARDRLRVARALEKLPGLREELELGRLAYSAVREVSRVAKPWNEEKWIRRIAGMSLREIEEELAGRQEGDDPEDEPQPDLALRQITFEMTPRTLALFREASRTLEDEVGHPLTDDEIIGILCSSALRAEALALEDACAIELEDDELVCAPVGTDKHACDERAGATEDPRAHVDTRRATQPHSSPPAPYQIAFTLCVHCKRATQDAAGRSFDVSPAAVEQALCNAQFLGRVDVDVPARATRNIPPATMRAVWRRDGGRCVVPGCRSTRHIEVHHIVFREHGGDHSMGNLACLCWAHHTALHEGRLIISGRAPDQLVFERIDPLIAVQRHRVAARAREPR